MPNSKLVNASSGLLSRKRGYHSGNNYLKLNMITFDDKIFDDKSMMIKSIIIIGCLKQFRDEERSSLIIK